MNEENQKKKKPTNIFTGSRESKSSRESASVEVLSAPTSPSEHEQEQELNNSQIGRNTLRSSKSKFHFIFFLVSL